MALRNILRDLSSDFGFSITNESERAFLIDRINRAAEKLHIGTELEGCYREVIFNLNQSSPQIVLPPYVWQVRGFRYVNSGVKGDIQVAQIRYHHGGFDRENWYLNFREIEPKRPLFRDIVNESTIKLSIPKANESSFTVTITGGNDNSDRIQEDVVFSETDLEKETSNVFNSGSITNISKNIRTNCNIFLYDVEDNLLAIIPNYETSQLEHVVLQITDEVNMPITDNWDSVELLFKIKFIPFQEDNDEFICGSKYDDAIIWKFIEIFNVRKTKDIEAALTAKGMVRETLVEIGEDRKLGKRMKLNRAPNPIFSAFSSLRGRSSWK